MTSARSGIVGHGAAARAREGAQAHRAREGRAERGQAPCDRARVPRRHRRPRRERRGERAAVPPRSRRFARSRPPRRSHPTTRRTRPRVAAMAASSGLPSCASTDLSGLYGLELRAVTAAVNASIMPIALRTASYVEEGVNAAGIDAPIMVMRGDGGATDLAGFKAAPARTLYSGPAASVAGALRYTRRARRHRRRGRRHVDERRRREARPPVALVRHGGVARDRAPRRRRARDRRRRRIDARARRRGGRSGASGPAPRTSPDFPTRASPTRRASTARRPVDDRPSQRRPRRLRRARAGRRHPVRDHAHLRGERAVDPRAGRLLLGRPGAVLASRSTSRAQHVGLDGDELARRMLVGRRRGGLRAGEHRRHVEPDQAGRRRRGRRRCRRARPARRGR